MSELVIFLQSKGYTVGETKYDLETFIPRIKVSKNGRSTFINLELNQDIKYVGFNSWEEVLINIIEESLSLQKPLPPPPFENFYEQNIDNGTL
jgi:hypothetical protein